VTQLADLKRSEAGGKYEAGKTLSLATDLATVLATYLATPSKSFEHWEKAGSWVLIPFYRR
jgi:hypothetical protein